MSSAVSPFDKRYFLHTCVVSVRHNEERNLHRQISLGGSSKQGRIVSDGEASRDLQFLLGHRSRVCGNLIERRSDIRHSAVSRCFEIVTQNECLLRRIILSYNVEQSRHSPSLSLSSGMAPAKL